MDEAYDLYLAALGARIKAARKACGLSHRDLVLKYGYNDSQWRRYERGGGLSLPSFVKLAVVLKTTPSALLDGIPLPNFDQMTSLRTPQAVPRSLRPLEVLKKAGADAVRAHEADS